MSTHKPPFKQLLVAQSLISETIIIWLLIVNSDHHTQIGTGDYVNHINYNEYITGSFMYTNPRKAMYNQGCSVHI